MEMFRFRRVLIARLMSNETLSCTKGMTVFQSKEALYGLFINVCNKKGACRKMGLYFRVSPTGRPI